MANKYYYLIILLVNLLGHNHSFELKLLDTIHLNSFFVKSNNLNNFKTRTPLPTDTSADLIRTIPVYFEEQCTLECLKNIFCARYSYTIENQKPVCSIYLRSSFKRPLIEPADNAKLSDSLDCNLQTCSDSTIYCSSTNLDKLNDGTCLCDVSSSKGTCDDKINSEISYDLSVWSEWSSCSATCGDGFKSRNKTCVKKYTDKSKNATVTETVRNQDWLCSSTLNDMFQVDMCNLGDCSMFTQWSSWSKCDRLCNGFRSRSRSCTDITDPKICNSNYLNEQQLCSSFDECNESYLKLEKTDGTSVANITNKGILKLVDLQKNMERKLYTQSDDKNMLRLISNVACREFGFNRSVNVIATPVRDNLMQKYTDQAEYLKHLNEQSVNGLNCTGNEVTIKDCLASSDANINTSLFEVEVECLFNAYWSTWSSWTPCSVTCGAGARTRIRTCNDPPPSISQYGNGDTCPNNPTDFASCIMPRCKV